MPRRPPPCPCGTGHPYAACCGPLLDGAPDGTPEQVMRSRYTAHVRGDAAHLLRTWHASTRPAEVVLDPRVRWTGLEVLAMTGPTVLVPRATVTFRAAYRDPDGPGALKERSAFLREGGAWRYVGPDA